ncbi:MAG: tripartite tricarboxylate transporter TctB family protein [Clostridia bacterium]|nr:tripartite tricarboxylate transporter TctB family protein [Clostridia bacterium]
MNMMKLTPEKAISFLLSVLGLVYILAGRNLDLGTLRSPVEGAIHLVAGLLLLGTAVLILLRRQVFAYEKIDNDTLARVIKLAALIVAYVFIMPLLGFKITTFLVLLISGYLLGNKKWLSSIIFSLLVTGVATYLFEGWLKLPLP